MKITLERTELIHIISKSLGYDVEDTDVSINAEPFEVSIRNVCLTGSRKTSGDLSETERYEEKEDEEPLTIEDLLRKNAAYGGPQITPKGGEDSTPMTRPLGPMETEEPPPVTQDEISAVLRGYSR